MTKIPKEKECLQIGDMRLKDANGSIILNDQNITTDIRESNVSEENLSVPVISSIPARIDQTQPEIIEPEVPVEPHTEPKPEPKKKRIIHRKKKRATQSLDLF
jgi:rod shape-determining protein MreC